MKKLTRYEIESKVREIAEDVADNFNLDYGFYGDCLPGEVMDLENGIELDQDESLFAEVESILEEYARAWYIVEVENKDNQNTNEPFKSTDLYECEEYAREMWNQLCDSDKQSLRINVYPAFNTNRECAEYELVLEM